MIDIRAGILAITFCFIIALAADVPPKPLPPSPPTCMQSYYNIWGDLIARQSVPCTDLDRYENA